MSKNVVFFPKFLQKLIKSKLFFGFPTEVLFAVILSILARARPLEAKSEAGENEAKIGQNFEKCRFGSK